jgi:signal peptidase I
METSAGMSMLDSPWFVVATVGFVVVVRAFFSVDREPNRQRNLYLMMGLFVALLTTVVYFVVKNYKPILLAYPVSAYYLWEFYKLGRADYRSARAFVLELADSALIAVLLVFCILRPFAIQAFFIPSGSMENTLLTGDRILVNKAVYFLREPHHGDIVVFRAPKAASPDRKDFIKRVVGLPGDRLQVHDGKLWRNGQPQDEPYIKEPPDYAWPDVGEVTVPPGTLLVMGDNRNDSNDSHRWEEMLPDGTIQPAPFVPRENVLGKATVIFWPPWRVRLLH